MEATTDMIRPERLFTDLEIFLEIGTQYSLPLFLLAQLDVGNVMHVCASA